MSSLLKGVSYDYGKWRQVAASGRWWKGLVAVGALMFASSPALAQNNPLPWDDLTEPAEYVTFDVVDTDWTLYPVITANNDFIGFFGYLPDEFVVGNNVSLLWLIPDNGDGTWSMYGWSNTDLKVVSDYLDDLTGTQNVLADTGLDIFSGEPQPITPPKSMPNGITIDDPAAPIIEATQDPVIAGALIAAGAAGAPNLTQATNLLPVDQCIAINSGGNISQLDIDLAYKSRVIQETMNVWMSVGILDSLEHTGMDSDEETLRACLCRPLDRTLWAPWSAWACTGPTAVWGGCQYTGCTRTRTGIRRQISIFCTITITNVTETQGPSTFIDPPNPDGTCPATHI